MGVVRVGRRQTLKFHLQMSEYLKGTVYKLKDLPLKSECQKMNVKNNISKCNRSLIDVKFFQEKQVARRYLL